MASKKSSPLKTIAQPASGTSDGATNHSFSSARYSARLKALLGISHEQTIIAGSSLTSSLNALMLWDESKSLLRDQLPAARRSLGADHNLTLRLNQNLAMALAEHPECTRDDPRLNEHCRAASA